MEGVERALLLSSLSDRGEHPQSAGLPAELAAALGALQRGAYTQALAATLRSALGPALPTSLGPEAPPGWFDLLRRRLDGLSTQAAADPMAAAPLLLAAVAALQLFGQVNLTGPPVTAPDCPFDLLGDDGAESGAGGAQTALPFGSDSASPGDRWALAQLAENGEDPLGLLALPQYLLLARTILVLPLLPGGAAAGSAAGAGAGVPAVEPRVSAAAVASLPGSWAWWAARALLLQQRTLAARSATLRALLVDTTALVLQRYGPLAGGGAAGGGDPQLAAAALLEAAAMEAAYGHVDSTRAHLERCCALLGLSVELTGAMGVRTVHQQEAKAQLVLRVERLRPCQLPAAAAGADAARLRAALDDEALTPMELQGLDAERDVLPAPQLLAPGGVDAAVQQPAAPPCPANLAPLEQAALLGLLLLVRKGSAADGLQPEEAAAYVAALASQARSEFLLVAATQLQGCRLEKSRPRTRERALLRLQRLADGMLLPEPKPSERMRCAFAAWFPLQPALRKELGELLVAAGAAGAALEIFEALELWDPLVVCYRLLGKKVQAEALVRRRLEAAPADPRLWCALGDLSLEDRHYERAWEVSGGRSARAARSLARNALRRQDHAAALRHWEAALALSPLHPEAWFSAGYSAIKAFSRCTALEPESGEAWTNLAAVHMMLDSWRPAYAALGEAVRLHRGSWQTWDNYARVAAQVGEWQSAAHGLQQVMALTQGEHSNLGVLADLVGAVERGRGVAGAPPDASAECAMGAEAAGRLGPGEQEEEGGGGLEEREASWLTEGAALAPPLAGLALSNKAAGGAGAGAAAGAVDEGSVRREQAALERAVGAALKQAALAASGDSALWQLYARFYQATGEPEAAAECLLKRVRALQGAAWQREPPVFERLADAAAGLCRCYLQAPRARELSSVRLLLRGVLRGGEERYGETPQYGVLRALLVEVEAAEVAACAS